MPGWRARPEDIGDFLYHLPEYRACLTEYSSRGNGEIQAKLDELLADEAALARDYHRRRAGGE